MPQPNNIPRLVTAIPLRYLQWMLEVEQNSSPVPLSAASETWIFVLLLKNSAATVQ